MLASWIFFFLEPYDLTLKLLMFLLLIYVLDLTVTQAFPIGILDISTGHLCKKIFFPRESLHMV